MEIVLTLLISLVPLRTQSTESPFNTYVVFLEKAHSPGRCAVADSEHFRNRSYSFRGSMRRDTPLVLRNGKALELNALGRPEWETELVQQSIVAVGRQSAVMLRFLVNHVSGSGSWGTVVIGTCDHRELTVLFEAESQGLSDVALKTDGILVVKRAVWSRSDAHCCPSSEAEERYRWDPASEHFVHVAAR